MVRAPGMGMILVYKTVEKNFKPAIVNKQQYIQTVKIQISCKTDTTIRI